MKKLIDVHINAVIYTILSKKSPLVQTDRYGNVMSDGEVVSKTVVKTIEAKGDHLLINRRENNYNNSLAYEIAIPMNEACKEVAELTDGSLVTLNKEACRELSRKQLIEAMEIERLKVVSAQSLYDSQLKEIRSRYLHILNF